MSWRVSLVIILFSCVIIATRLPAQYASMIRYTSENGLPHTETISVCIDNQGYLWVSMNTRDIVRFDGRTFKEFPDIGKSLAVMVPDPEAGIWGTSGYVDGGGSFITQDGMGHHFYFSNKHPRAYKNLVLKDSLPFGNFRVNPVNQAISFISYNYRFLYDATSKGFVFADSLPASPQAEYSYLYEDYWEGQHIIVSRDENKIVTAYEMVDGQLQQIKLPAGYKKEPEWTVIKVNKAIVFLHPRYGALARNNQGSWEKYLHPVSDKIEKGAVVNKVELLPEDHFIIELRDGNIHYIFDYSCDLKHYKLTTFQFEGGILDLTVDKAGTYWLASHSGLLRVFPAFTNYFATENPAMVSEIHTVVEDHRGRIWFGSYSDGLGFIENEVVHEAPPALQKFRKILPGSHRDQHGNLLFIVESQPGRGLLVIDTTGKLQMPLPGQLGYIIKTDKKGNVLYGTSGKGLFIQNDQNCGYADSCWQKIGEDYNFELLNVIGTVQDQFDHYWMGRPSAGIAIYLPKRDTLIQFLRAKNQTGYGAWSLATDKWGNLWMGTTAGLRHLNPPDQINAGFSLDQHLKPVATDVFGESDMPSILNRNDDLLAMLTFTGFGLLDLKSFYNNAAQPKTYYFTWSEGYLGGAGEQNSLITDRRGRFWFGNDKGVTCFDPERFIPDTTRPVVKITQVISFGDTLQLENGFIKNMRSKHTNLILHFADFNNPHLFNNTRFHVQLDGDSALVTTENFFEYYKLAPGRYTFKIFATRAGTMSEPEILHFRIPPVWYQSPWLYAVGALLILGFVGLWYRMRIIQERQRRELLTARVQAIVNQLNPHFINNTLNWVQIRADDQQDDEAVAVIGKLASNLKIIFQNSRSKRSFHTLEEEIQVVENYFHIQKVRFEEKVNYSLPNPAIVERWGKSVNVPLMILQIHVENAIEHGLNNRIGGGWVSVNIEETEDYLILIVEDNGVGRREARRIGLNPCCWKTNLPGAESSIGSYPLSRKLKLSGKAEGIDEAFELINEHRPKAAFMDIKLVGGNAFQLMDRLEKHHIPVPWVIMITGFPEYAVDVLNQYKDRVIKFLPKPVLEKWNEKLRDAVDALVLTVREESDKGYFIVKTENTIERIPYAELAWVEVAPGGRIYLVTDLNEYLTNTTLTQFLKDYPKAPLRQVSRNYAVNSARIKRIIRDERGVVIAYRGEDKFISIGDNYYNGLISDL